MTASAMLLCNRSVFKLPPHCMMKTFACNQPIRMLCCWFPGNLVFDFPASLYFRLYRRQILIKRLTLGWPVRKLTNFGLFRWKMVAFFVLLFFKRNQLGIWRISWRSTPERSSFFVFLPFFFSKLSDLIKFVTGTDNFLNVGISYPATRLHGTL